MLSFPSHPAPFLSTRDVLTSEENHIEFTHFPSLLNVFNVLSHLLTEHFGNNCSWTYSLTEIQTGQSYNLGFSRQLWLQISAHSLNNGLQFLAEKYYRQKYKTEYSELLPQSLGNVLLNSLFNKLNLIDVYLGIPKHEVLWDTPTWLWHCPCLPGVHSLVSALCVLGGGWKETGEAPQSVV